LDFWKEQGHIPNIILQGKSVKINLNILDITFGTFWTPSPNPIPLSLGTIQVVPLESKDSDKFDSGICHNVRCQTQRS
jgi:hypothetical protein